jgi:hypothetical protein
MTDRVLRWLTASALVLLVLDAAWNIAALPPLVVHLPFVIAWGPGFILGYFLVPSTDSALCEVAGVATLVVSLQRKQWSWFVGALLCLVVQFYAGLLLDVPTGMNDLYKLAGSSIYSARTLLSLYFVLVRTPTVLLAFVYAWTRRSSAIADAAG